MFQIPNKKDEINLELDKIIENMPYTRDDISKSYKYWIYAWCVAMTKDLLNENSNIMDAGPGGLGHILWYFSNVLGYKNVYATDLRNKRKKLGKIDNLTYKKESLLKTSYEDGFFDGIFNISVIEHMSPNDVDLFFDEMYRILKPDGFLIVSTVEKTESLDGKKRLNPVSMQYIKDLKQFKTQKCGNYYKHPSLKNNDIYVNKRENSIFTEYIAFLRKKK